MTNIHVKTLALRCALIAKRAPTVEYGTIAHRSAALVVINLDHARDARLPIDLYSYGVYAQTARGYVIEQWSGASYDVVALEQRLYDAGVRERFAEIAWQSLTEAQLDHLKRHGALESPPKLVLHAVRGVLSKVGLDPVGQEWRYCQPTRGTDTCTRCGEAVTAGYLAITNAAHPDSDFICLEHVELHCTADAPCPR